MDKLKTTILIVVCFMSMYLGLYLALFPDMAQYFSVNGVLNEAMAKTNLIVLMILIPVYALVWFFVVAIDKLHTKIEGKT